MKPSSLRHAVLHLMDYLGDAAKVAEHLDHGEGQEAKDKALALLHKRFTSSGSNRNHWAASTEALVDHLRRIAGGDAYVRDEPRADPSLVPPRPPSDTTPTWAPDTPPSDKWLVDGACPECYGDVEDMSRGEALNLRCKNACGWWWWD